MSYIIISIDDPKFRFTKTLPYTEKGFEEALKIMDFLRTQIEPDPSSEQIREISR